MIAKLRKINLPLIIGIIIIIFISIIAIFRIDIMNLDPFATNFALPHFEDGNLVVDRPPNPPNDINIWGTDLLGRDVFSRVIYGARMTLQIGIYTALARILVGVIFGLLAGFGSKIVSKIINIFKTTFSAIPALIISFIFLKVTRPPLEEALLVYTIVLTFVGWGRVGSIFRDRISEILREDFIKGEMAIGKSKFQIAIGNVLPHLLATIVIYLFIEVSRVLIILGELGVLGLLVGLNAVDPFLLSELKLSIEPAYFPEWGSMLGTSRYAISAGIPWIVLYPALALFISVLGFNLLGEGLKIELNKRNSKFITFIKHIPYHLSPITFIHQIKNMNRYKKSVVFKISIVVLMILILLWPARNSKYKIDVEGLNSHIEELSKEKYEDRSIETEGNKNARNYIVENLKTIGLGPLYENKFIKPHQIEANIQSIQEMNLDLVGKDISFDYKDEFNVGQLYVRKIDENIYSTEITRNILSIEMYENGDYEEEEKYFILISQEEQKKDTGKITDIINQPFIKGTITELDELSRFDVFGDSVDFEVMQDELESDYVHLNIYVNSNSFKKIKENSGSDIEFSAIVKNQIEAQANNIGAVLKGKDSEKSPLIIATDYDNEGIIYNGSSIAANLEIAKTLKESKVDLERDIIFLFFDASFTKSEKGIDAFSKTDLYKDLDKTHFLMYIKNLGGAGGELIAFDTSRLYSDNRGHYGII
ncbi:MAG: ABC transporter permease subunit, partial [Senegalia sp. (in: firmicutes)]